MYCGSRSGAVVVRAKLTAEQKAEKIRTNLSDYFTRSMGEGVTVVVRDLGCHHEADILKDGQVVKKLSINGSTITDIT